MKKGTAFLAIALSPTPVILGILATSYMASLDVQAVALAQPTTRPINPAYLTPAPAGTVTPKGGNVVEVVTATTRFSFTQNADGTQTP